MITGSSMDGVLEGLCIFLGGFFLCSLLLVWVVFRVLIWFFPNLDKYLFKN